MEGKRTEDIMAEKRTESHGGGVAYDSTIPNCSGRDSRLTSSVENDDDACNPYLRLKGPQG